ncbi:MAG: sigma 54-interacting transcriptional regulator [Desulfobacterales bacterium]|jgi:PAS domain S-box-containing protein
MGSIELSYQQMAGLFDFLSAGVVVLSPDREVLNLNRTAEMLTECSRNEAIGRRCREVFGTYLCDGDCLFEQAIQSGEPVLSRTLPSSMSDATGSFTKMVSPVFDRTGEISACIEVFQDVSMFTELVDRLGDEGRKMREILDLLDIGVFSSDRGGHVTFFNAMAEAITGFNRRELLGKPCRSVFHPDFCSPRPAEIDKDDPRPNEAKEVQITTRKGQSIPVRAKTIPLRGSGGSSAGMLTTFTDLSLVYQYRNVLKDRSTFHDMVSTDPKMQRIIDMLPAIAETDTTVLIEGPTGAGKDLLAKVIHTISPRADAPLVKVNCAALPDNLLESELFGYTKGAFTGAERDKPGRFQEADGGTIFLDEIGDMPLALQAKLLRVLEDREFYPLGGRRPCRVDVRILSATNRGLKELVAEKRFREDLYYRLNVMRIDLPPLKERRADIPALIEHILKKLCLLTGTSVKAISKEAMATLLNHDYPGNIRELENILEYALIVSRGSAIDTQHLPTSIHQEVLYPAEAKTAKRPSDTPPDDDRQRILKALEENGWNKSLTARRLHMDRSTLWRKMKKFAIQG